MKWNSNQARRSGEGAEWSASGPPDTSDGNSSPLPGMYRDNYYHVIATNTESRSVTVRTLDGALHFWNALQR